MSRPRKPVQTAAEALAATRHLLVGPDAPTRRRRTPMPTVIPIEGTPKLHLTGPGLAGVTEAYVREWRARHRNGGRERRTRGGAA